MSLSKMYSHFFTKKSISYDEWLTQSLISEEEAVAFLRVSLQEFDMDGNFDALLNSLKYILSANLLKKKEEEKQMRSMRKRKRLWMK